MSTSESQPCHPSHSTKREPNAPVIVPQEELWDAPSHLIRRDPYFFTRTNPKPDALHVKQLVATLRNVGKLDPILLWQGKGGLILLDGAHRLAAYHAANWKKGIPSRIIRCTKREALLRAGAENAKASIPLSGPERADFAWKLVRHPEGNYSKSEIVAASGVSKGTVDNMRSRWATMRWEGVEPSGQWFRDRRANTLDTYESPEDEARQAAVKELGTALLEVLNGLHRRDSELVAEALHYAVGYRLEAMIDHLFGGDDEEEDYGEDDDLSF